jgi:hypothetical protein
MSNQLTNKKNYLFILPCDIVSLIFEFEGSQKENYNKILKEFQKILETRKLYKLAFNLPERYGDFILRKVPGIHSTPIYKFILNQNKVISKCECNEPCCYRFQYSNLTSYSCGCHEKKEAGLVYSYHVNNQEKLSIRKEKTGFCVKITRKIPNLPTNISRINLLTAFDENGW